MAEAELKRELGLFDTTMMNVGGIIGSGIFLVPAVIATLLDGWGPILTAWLLGGMVALLGALALAELGAAMPHAGGPVVYLNRAFGPVWGYLYGWSAAVVTNPAGIAAIAYAFATYLAFFVPLDQSGVKLVAIASIVLLTALNCLGIRLGAVTNNILSSGKLLALAAIVAGALLFPGGSWENVPPLWPAGAAMGAFGLAMVAVLWTYDGWVNLSYLAGEMRDPQRTLSRAALWSMVLLTGLYLLVNAALMYVLPLSRMAGRDLVLADAVAVTLGAVGATLVAAAIVLSTLSATHVTILSAARVPFAMAREGLFFEWAGLVHPRWRTPSASLLAQAALAIAFTATGTFNQLITYVIFVSYVFFALCAAAVIRLRRTAPDLPRPYRTWGYPVTPVLFIVFALGLVANTILEAPREAAIGAVIVLLGLPGYALFRAGRRRVVPA
ncbi:MAG: amino acid permease [Gemmatimonadota bacterium]|nr:amino acid permease [Gemmatimonadota bacterium]